MNNLELTKDEIIELITGAKKTMFDSQDENSSKGVWNNYWYIQLLSYGINNKPNYVKYILENQSQNMQATEIDSFFNTLAQNGTATDVIDYMIFDYKIVETPKIKKYLKEHELINVKMMFDNRKLNKKLQKDLPNKIIINRKKI